VKVWLNALDAVPVVVAGFVTLIVWQVMVRLYVAPTPVAGIGVGHLDCDRE